MTETVEGELVADFEALATADRTIRLSDFRGRPIVLYFYPKDHTPGCTREGQDFRDHFAEFEALGAVIFGISRDSVRTHENFKAKQHFPFDLISDPEETLCRRFDVIKMKNMYGKQVRGIERSTFLIDKRGILAKAWRKVNVTGHVDDVLDALRQLGQR